MIENGLWQAVVCQIPFEVKAFMQTAYQLKICRAHSSWFFVQRAIFKLNI